MSKSTRGDRTYRREGPTSRGTLTICRRGGPASTARSTTSVDTNVLLKRADDVGLDTARSAVSVDTDVLLGDLASAGDLEEPRDVSETEAPLNSTYDQSPHLSPSTGTKAPTGLNVQALISSSSTGTEAATNSISSQSSFVKKLSSEIREARIPTHSTSSRLTSSSSTGTEAKWNQTTSLPSSSTGTKATLISTYTNQPASLLPSSSTDDVVANQFGDRAHFHADRMSRTQLDRSQVTARSVASADCAPVDYDDDVLLDHRGSSGFEVSASDKRRSSEGPCLVSVSRNGSSGSGVSLSDKCRLSEVSRYRDRFRVSSFGLEVPALDKRLPSEGPCPVTVYRNGSSSSEVSVSNRRQFSEVCSSGNNERDHFHVVSSGFEVSASDKRRPSEGPCPVSTYHCGSSGFETPVLDQRRLSENDDSLCQVTARSDSSLDAAMMLRDSTFSPPAVDDVLPDSGTTSRTLASVDTNVLLQTTEDVVTAMEAARTNHHSHISSRDPSPPIRNDSVLSYENTDRSPYAMDDVHADADYETETVDMGNTGMVLPHSSVLTKPPPAHGKSHANSATSYGRHGTKEAWGNLSDYDIAGDIGTSSEQKYGGHKTVQISQKRAVQGDSDSGSEYVGRPYTALRPELERRRPYTGQLRCRSGARTYPGQDSDRSLASSASLGEKIVARSRQNQQRTASGKSSRTSTRTSTRKNTQQQQQHDRDLSPSGLVLEGCRVQLRRTFSNSHERAADSRPSSAVTRRPTVNNARSTAATSVTYGGSGSRLHQSGRSESRTSPSVGGGLRSKTQNGWTEDLSSLNDSLCTEGGEPSGPAALSHQVGLR